MSDKVRAIIEAATPGPWEANATAVDYPYVIHDGEDIASFDTMSNTIYCATFDPEHVALMEAEIQAGRKCDTALGRGAIFQAESEYDFCKQALDAYREERWSSGQ